MNCSEARNLIEPYLDSELDIRTSLELREHVRACVECGQAFDSEAMWHKQIKTALARGDRTPRLWHAIESRLVENPGLGRHPEGAASAARRSRAGSRETSWLYWLWPSPAYYAGLAAVWAVMLAARLGWHESSSDRATASAPSSPVVRAAFAEQRQMVAELLDKPVVTTDAPVRTGPRSQDRESRHQPTA
jgi:hypothetical protein